MAFELEGVELDRCVVCGGTWLDAGELEWITELASVRPGSLTEVLETARGDKHGKRACPRCGRKLQIVHVHPANPLEIDRCPHGHGLWLDAGEMEAFIRSFEDSEEEAVARFLATLTGSEARPGSGE